MALSATLTATAHAALWANVLPIAAALRPTAVSVLKKTVPVTTMPMALPRRCTVLMPPLAVPDDFDVSGNNAPASCAHGPAFQRR
ncbi:hypothetical protein [Streptomyces sp. NPDC101165]|uniref:hypothetical protein n=1 Tax=Streptomyces sp. NPDC101165 TaxID=3366119 RepID=UPI00382FD33D